MSYFIRKLHVAIAFLLAASVGYVNGDYENYSGCCDVEDCCPCQPSCCGNIFVSADLLYWRAFEGGIDTCIPGDFSNTVTRDGRVITRFSGRTRNPNFKWNPGFRIGAGYEFACSKWDVEAIWTHFNSHSHSEEIRWKINLDVVDVIAGYRCDTNCCFVLIPFAGLRGARIDQSLRTGDFDESISFSLANNRVLSDNRNKQDFLGLGPIFGLAGDLDIGCGLSVYASASVSWLYGRFNVRLHDSQETFDTANICNERRRLDANLAGADAAIGIRWRQCFCNTQLILALGLEHHRYFDYNRLCSYGDLSFDGVNLSAGIEF